ncbi:putative non-specific serine/threonine protein kinase [Helianthus annuus]|nr:putative non-specific serine/threonine protein kinase [Helianthus annuus]KAJ0530242.1 putative non-specific serine/threonine protein kinase [Helianthus annuus]
MCKMGKMKKLLMIQNNFTGGLPENYASCTSLIRLRVKNNSLSGRVPFGIWSLPNLGITDLEMNQFEGQVGRNIGEAKSLAHLFLANNRFSGELPMEISMRYQWWKSG